MRVDGTAHTREHAVQAACGSVGPGAGQRTWRRSSASAQAQRTGTAHSAQAQRTAHAAKRKAVYRAVVVMLQAVAQRCGVQRVAQATKDAPHAACCHQPCRGPEWRRRGGGGGGQSAREQQCAARRLCLGGWWTAAGASPQLAAASYAWQILLRHPAATAGGGWSELRPGTLACGGDSSALAGSVRALCGVGV